jgi:hypothetical protein
MLGHDSSKKKSSKKKAWINFIKKMVSSNRRRYIDSDFNLDLTYMTPRLLAMGYPSSGCEALYRNRATEVIKFLSTYHKGKAKVRKIVLIFI